MADKVSWIYDLRKEELITLLAENHCDTEGSLDDLRRRVKTLIRTQLGIINPRQPAITGPSSEPPVIMTTEHRPLPPTADSINLIRKWGCQFDGRDALAFLERVEELRSSYGLTPEEVLTGLPVLLKGEPLLWYRNVRDSVRTWEEFEKELRLYYVPRRIKAQLEREIRDRIQTPTETFVHYATALQTLMRRAGGISEEEKLDRIYENMKPVYRRHIRRRTLQSTSQLIEEAIELEEIERLEVEYTTTHNRNFSASRPTRQERVRETMATVNAPYNRDECCWRCGKRGHHRRECRNTPQKFCSQCGTTGRLTRDCHCQEPEN